VKWNSFCITNSVHTHAIGFSGNADRVSDGFQATILGLQDLRRTARTPCFFMIAVRILSKITSQLMEIPDEVAFNDLVRFLRPLFFHRV
jgi:hypothetical protein